MKGLEIYIHGGGVWLKNGMAHFIFYTIVKFYSTLATSISLYSYSNWVSIAVTSYLATKNEINLTNLNIKQPSAELNLIWQGHLPLNFCFTLAHVLICKNSYSRKSSSLCLKLNLWNFILHSFLIFSTKISRKHTVCSVPFSWKITSFIHYCGCVLKHLTSSHWI